MDLDVAVVSKALASPQAFAEARSLGVSADVLFDEARSAWEFADDFFRKHGAVPSAQAVEVACGFKPADAPDPVGYYVEKAMARWKLNALSDGMRATTESVKAADADGAVRILSEVLARIRERTGTADSLVDYVTADARKHRLEEYARVAALGEGVDGLRTPWPTIDAATHGIHDDEMWSVLGTKKSGKTFALVAFALGVWNKGENKVLFVSEEMGVWKLMRRVDAMRSRLPYEDFLGGKLSTEARRLWETDMDGLEGKAPFLVAGRARAATVAELESLVREVRPRCVLLDGAYFLDAEAASKSKWERTARVVDRLQAMVQRVRIPLVLTWQFNRSGGKANRKNREAKQGDEAKGRKESAFASSEEVAFAYELTMASDVVLGFYRDDDAAKHNEAYVRIVDSREGKKVEPVRIHCDFATMDFSEDAPKAAGSVAAVDAAAEREPGEDDDAPLGGKQVEF